ncbi:HU family DNA-binding protein [Thermodesulfobacteriota bacterium]
MFCGKSYNSYILNTSYFLTKHIIISMFYITTNSLKKRKSEPVTLVGFGTFKVNKRKARKGRNPQTGEVIKIKASRVVKFKAGKALKETV